LVDAAEVKTLFAEMAATGKATLKSENVPDRKIEINYSADIRYVGQFNEVEVPLPSVSGLNKSSLKKLANDFHARHDSLYGYSMADAPLELINLRITARGKTEKPKQDKYGRKGASAAHARIGKRRAYFDGRFREAPVYDGLKLDAGNKVAGPAIVVQPTTTIIVPPDFELMCDDYRNYLMYGKGESVDRLCKALR